jgi:hypothetical protein
MDMRGPFSAGTARVAVSEEKLHRENDFFEHEHGDDIPRFVFVDFVLFHDIFFVFGCFAFSVCWGSSRRVHHSSWRGIHKHGTIFPLLFFLLSFGG